MEGHKRLISTAHLPKDAMALANGVGITIDEVPLTAQEFIYDSAVIARVGFLAKSALNVVFTSANAVKAVKRLCTNAPMWNMWCVGDVTSDLAAEFFPSGSVAFTGPNARELGKEMLRHQLKEVVFYCGDKRMDTLPDLLRNGGVNCEEIIVYTTIATPSAIRGAYHGILFFSPSAVDSFFNWNSLPSSVTVFAIGETTSNALRKYSTHQIITASFPSKNEVVNDAIQYFTSH